MKLKLGFISDTHCLHNKIKIPECDILFHSGDVSGRGHYEEIDDFLNWYSSLDQALFKVFVFGNHDRCKDPRFFTETEGDKWVDSMFEEFGVNKKDGTLFYLENSGLELLNLKIWGSPYTPSFYRSHWSFNADRGEEIKAVWDQIPYGLDVLITHGPPYGILDWIPKEHASKGCEDLLYSVLKKRPTIHSFGHLHNDGGEIYKGAGMYFINAAMCDEQYRPKRSPVVIEYDLETKEILKIS